MISHVLFIPIERSRCADVAEARQSTASKTGQAAFLKRLQHGFITAVATTGIAVFSAPRVTLAL